MNTTNEMRVILQDENEIESQEAAYLRLAEGARTGEKLITGLELAALQRLPHPLREEAFVEMVLSRASGELMMLN